MFVEVLFENKKKVNCPAYFSAWNAEQDKKGKKKKKKNANIDPKAGTVVTANGDSVAFQMVYVPRTQNGLVDKKKPRQPRKNPDPRAGYKPKRKPLDPEKHN
jgi:hypothetical protein